MRKEMEDLKRDSHSKYLEEKLKREVLEKEIVAIKRQRLDSCGSSSTTTTSASRSRAGDFPACGQRFPIDMNQEDSHQAQLSFGRLEMPDELKDPLYTHSWAK